MKFSEKIVRLRKVKGITQDELASAVGVSRQAVYKWECGQSYPEVAKLIELKLLFNISIDDLLDESYEIALPEKKKKKRLNRTQQRAVEKEVNEAMLKEKEPEAISHAEEPVVIEVAAEPAHISAAAEPEVILSAAVEEAPAEAPTAEAPVKEAEAVAEPTSDEAEPVRKAGFFGRLFGRK